MNLEEQLKRVIKKAQVYSDRARVAMEEMEQIVSAPYVDKAAVRAAREKLYDALSRRTSLLNVGEKLVERLRSHYTFHPYTKPAIDILRNFTSLMNLHNKMLRTVMQLEATLRRKGQLGGLGRCSMLCGVMTRRYA